MSYFEEVDAWLTAVLLPDDEKDEDQWLERVKKQVKAKILESYRNGQGAPLKPKASTDERPRAGGKPSFRSRFRRNERP